MYFSHIYIYNTEMLFNLNLNSFCICYALIVLGLFRSLLLICFILSIYLFSLGKFY